MTEVFLTAALHAVRAECLHLGCLSLTQVLCRRSKHYLSVANAWRRCSYTGLVSQSHADELIPTLNDDGARTGSLTHPPAMKQCNNVK